MSVGQLQMLHIYYLSLISTPLLNGLFYSQNIITGFPDYECLKHGCNYLSLLFFATNCSFIMSFAVAWRLFLKYWMSLSSLTWMQCFMNLDFRLDGSLSSVSGIKQVLVWKTFLLIFKFQVICLGFSLALLYIILTVCLVQLLYELCLDPLTCAPTMDLLSNKKYQFFIKVKSGKAFLMILSVQYVFFIFNFHPCSHMWFS